MRHPPTGLAALFVAASFFGCSNRCEDRGQDAVQAMLPQLNQAVVSNLVREASVCIANSSAQPVVGPYYMPSLAEAPIAHGLKPESGSEVKFSMGPNVVVHTRGASAPYMSIRVPVYTGSGVCMWGVYVCIKPGVGFAKDNTNSILDEQGTNATPVVKLSEEVLVYAERRNLQ